MFDRETVKGGDNKFLVSLELGTALGSLKYCRVIFDPSKVSDELFKHFEIPLPAHIALAVGKRKAEYLAGRICCKQILRSMGLTAEEVLCNYPDRAPVWPVGLTGSISHCASEALAVITTEQIGHVGVDVEELGSDLITTYADSFTSAEERQQLSNTSELAVAFSAKEALFKALYPRLKFYFGFECASVEILDADRFKIRLTCPLGPGFPKHRSWVGHYVLAASTVTTLLLDAPEWAAHSTQENPSSE